MQYADPNADKEFPSYRYPPDGTEGRVFQRGDAIPEGWLDRPAGADSAAKEATEDAAMIAAAISGKVAPDAPVGDALDANGTAWSADRNTSDKAKTGGGLWQLKPGQSRPAPAEGYPKAALDL